MRVYNNSVVLRNDGVDPSTSAADLNAALGVNVTVRVASTPVAGLGALASIFNIADVAIANPMQTDNKGNYQFKVADSVYDIVIAEGTADEAIIAAVQIVEFINPITSLAIPYVFDTVASMVASTIVFPVGKKLTVSDYATGHNSGVLFFTVVAAGTGTADGGQYIDLPAISLQVKQNLHFPYSVKAWGAAGAASGNANDLAFVAIMDFAVAQRGNAILRVIFDLGGETYDINNPFIVRATGFSLRNGTLNQTQNTRDCMQTKNPGGVVYYLTLDNVALNIEGTSNQFSGVNFRIVTGTLGWFRWTGLNTTMLGGKHLIANGYGTAGGVDGYTGAATWECRFISLHAQDTYSSAVLWPAAGGVFSTSSGSGGTTTLKFENVAVAFIKSQAPAFRIGNNVSHLILENCSADSCTKFGAFLVSTLIMNNCSMELIRAPTDPTLNAAFYADPTHDLIFVGNQQNFHLNGFTTAFDSLLSTTPHPDTRAVSTNGGSSYIEGLVGGMVTGGRPVHVSTGSCELKGISMPNAESSKAINNGAIHDVNGSRRVSTVAQTGTFDMWTIQPDGLSRVYIVSTLYTFGGNSSINTLVVHTSGESGSIQGDSASLLNGIYAGAVTINIVGDKVQASVSGATYVTWSAVEMTVI